MRRFLRNNGLSITLVSSFLVIWLAGQTTSGHRVYNAELQQNGESPISFLHYLRTPHFGEATFENWESEFLQMGVYVVLTVWLRQKRIGGVQAARRVIPTRRGPRRPSRRSRRARGRSGAAAPGWRSTSARSASPCSRCSLSRSSCTPSRAAAVFNAEQSSPASADHGDDLEYLVRAQFWFESLQNWQSEFLAVGAIVILTIFLRQHGSPESKPVHASHSSSGRLTLS